MQIIKYLISALIFFVPSVQANMNEEVQYLLNYVSSTSCQYERNGDLHSGEDAVKHINKKYQYFKKKIKSAEDFIRLSATQSTMSGRKYKIHCSGEKTVPSGEWLLKELSRFRESTKLKNTL